MPRRILFTIDSLFALDTPAHQLALLTAGLAEKDFEVHVASLGDPRSVSHEFSPAVKLHFLARTKHRDWLLPRRIRSLVKRIHPNIVHAWGIHSHKATFAFQRSTSKFAQFCTYLEMPQTHQPILRRWLHESLTENITSIVSHDAIADALAVDGFDREFVVIENGVQPQSPMSGIRQQVLKHLEIPDSSILCCSIGQFQPRTRLKDLIWAADLLYAIREDVHLVLIGSGPQRKRLQKFLWQTKAGPNVHFIDPQAGSNEFLNSNVFGAIDIYWNPHFIQPNSSPMLQAMQQGVPVISVFGPGTNNLIRHQQTAMGVNFGARDEFARWTKYFIEQSESAKKLTSQAQQFIKRFDTERMIERYLSCYG